MLRVIAPLTALCFVLPTGVQAELADVSCHDRTRLTQTLENAHGATRQGTGLRDPDTMLEVWVVARNGEWVIVQNYANGTACIVAMGEHWEGAKADPA